MARPEKPLSRDGTPLCELAWWLRDLRGQAGLTYDQLAKRTNFSRATLQEALSGRRLPTWQVTQAIVRACGGDEEPWHSYWAQAKRAADRDAPPGSTASVTPPWVARSPSSAEPCDVPSSGDRNSRRATPTTHRLPQRWIWAAAGGAVVVAIGILTPLLVINGAPAADGMFPNPYHHPKAPLVRAVARTYTEQEFNPNGAPTFAHLDASGAGIPVAYGQFVQVSCKIYNTVVKSAKPDGYWYRLASLPWSNNYYAVANTFGNGDKLHHPPYTHNTDWQVPNCK